MSTFFLSDLHLDPSRPEITALALAFLRGPALQADAIYLLGDVFEAWIGDDAIQPPADALAQALKALNDAGVRCISSTATATSCSVPTTPNVPACACCRTPP
jgi:Uncharacterized protein conserved in bacteria